MRTHASLILCAVLSTSCARACAPELVAQGASRLTVRTFGAVVELVNNDDRCGFASPDVLANPELREDSVVYSVENCELNYARRPYTSEGCDGSVTKMRGKVIVSAKRVVRGTITGDPNNPVIPANPDAVTVTITDAVFSSFTVEGEQQLTVYEGSISGKAEPRLARSASLGVCKVPTRDVLFSEISWGPTNARILADGHDIELTIDSSELVAILGQREEGENILEGAISVWGTEYNIPLEGDTDGLLPGYERGAFVESFACAEDLAQPLSFECDSFSELVAGGAAKLTVLAFGTVAGEVNDNCRFGGLRLSGMVGERGGTGVWDLGAGCSIAGATVRGTKTVRGIVSGDPDNPIVPTSAQPAELDLDIEFHDFSVTTDDGMRTLVIGSGSLSGIARPRLALDPETRVCSVATEDATFSGMKWANASGRIEAGDRRTNIEIGTSDLDADVGSNTLDGSITVDGESHELRGPIFATPATDEECGLHAMLGEAVARLTVRSLGALSKAVNTDDSCGFKAFLVESFASDKSGRPGELGFVEHTVDDCELELDEVSSDCLGHSQEARGDAVVSAVRTVQGRRENEFWIFASIEPLRHDSVTLELDAVVDHLLVADDRSLMLERGRIHAVIHPMTGENATDPGRFNIPTPVAHFASVELTDVVAVVRASGKTFRVRIDSATLEAQNGSFDQRANALRGEMVVDGKQIEIPLMPLDPQYDQAEFDASYACTTDLTAPVPPASTSPPSL